MTDRIEKEKKFHNDRFAEDTRKHLDKYYSITFNTSKLYKDILYSNVSGKVILEYGCGEGSESFGLAQKGAYVYGIDISDVAIEKAQKIASAQNLNDKIKFYVMNAEELSFPENYFDIICGSAILHHLDLNKALSALVKSLKIDGRAIFLEPLGHNIFINIYRKITGSLRTEDEHPLKKKDLDLFNKYFNKIDIQYFHLTTLMSIPFRKLGIFKLMLSLFERLDKFLFRYPFFKWNAWIVVIELTRPIKK